MKKIKFACRGGIYEEVEKSFINPIVKFLPKDSWEISIGELINNKWYDYPDKDNFNVSFFADIKEQFDFFICHGIGDKNYRNTDEIHNFKYIGISGELWVDKLVKQGIDKNKLKVIGYSKLDPVFQNYKKIQHNDNKIHVLYAPTHNTNPTSTHTVSSYPRLNSGLENLSNKIELKCSYHPANQERKITFIDEYNWADVVIADAGSTIYEALALGIPVVIPDWLCSENVFRNFPNSFEQMIYQDNIGYHAKNIKHMEDLLFKAAQDGLDGKTTQFIEGIFPTRLRGNSGQEIANLFLELNG